MTPSARQRLQIEFDRADYRARVAKRIGILLAAIGIISLLLAAVTRCRHRNSEFPKLTEPERQAFKIFNQ